MKREISTSEDVPLTISLSEAEAQTLSGLGRELSAKAAWWGDKEIPTDRSVIKVVEQPGGRYRVTFQDVVGMVRVGDLQVNVLPKIPSTHFWHIVCHSELAPRISSAPVAVSEGLALIELLARWCVEAAEKLLRVGLRKDYKENLDELDEVRGQIQALETAERVYRGAAVAVCRFEELSEDTSLNRIVKSACERIARLGIVSQPVRGRARRVVYRMDGVGSTLYTDMRVRLDRLTMSYSRVLPLSLLVLNGCGISAAYGKVQGLAFLIRTPELVEDGLRSILASGIPTRRVAKRKLLLGGSGMSINPDLVFGEDLAIGDVKYRRLSGDWHKPDFNQIVTFATGFRSQYALLIGFCDSTTSILPRPVKIGPVHTKAFSWVASPQSTPASSGVLLVTQVSSWLKGLEQDVVTV